METSSLTARQLYAQLQANPTRPRFGFGRKPIVVNVDLQKAYTLPAEYPGAYDGDPKLTDYVNDLAAAARAAGLPVVWTYVAYLPSGEDAGVFGSREDKPHSLKNIKRGSRQAELDDRLAVDHDRDIVINKLMPSAFFETSLQSLMTWHGCDTVIVTGGSTSGCVRATVVDSVSRGYRTVVPEECVADRHESPHFANLYDMRVKYADVLPVADVLAHLGDHARRNDKR